MVTLYYYILTYAATKLFHSIAQGSYRLLEMKFHDFSMTFHTSNFRNSRFKNSIFIYNLRKVYSF